LYRQKGSWPRNANRTETLRLNEMFSALLAHEAEIAEPRFWAPRGSYSGAPVIRTPMRPPRIVPSGNRYGRLIQDMLISRARLAGPHSSTRILDFRAWLRVIREHQTLPGSTDRVTSTGEFFGFGTSASHRSYPI